MTPWLQDPDVTLYHGDCLKVLGELPAGSVHMCATSPPFYGLRDYGAEGQIGLEETPDEWVNRLVAVFREVRRVLRDDGTLWVEIGDSYANGSIGRNDADRNFTGGGGNKLGTGNPGGGIARSVPGHKPKDLLGQPWLLAFALRADGWWLRGEIIWARPNPMPESVTDRPTKAHSTVFLLSKSPRYFYDADAIREDFRARPQQRLTESKDQPLGKARIAAGVQQGNPQGGTHVNRFLVQEETLGDLSPESPRGPDGRRLTTVRGGDNSEQHRDGERWPNPSGANARSVWTVPTEPTPFAHFATWPQALVRRMILAGTSERGCCPECGAPWVRKTEQDSFDRRNDRLYGGTLGHNPSGKVPGSNTRGMPDPRRRVLGWTPSCANIDHLERVANGLAAPAPCTVLDPFAGSGTTSLVARNHGRHSIGIELNENYLEIAARRLQQLSLFASEPPPPVLGRHKGLTGGAYNPPGQSPHSNARSKGSV